MKAFIVYAHPEPKSFNGALLQRGVETLTESHHDVKVSDLYAMKFDPVSDRRNFLQRKDPHTFKQQQEEMHATERNGFAAEIALEMDRLRWCDLLIFQFPLWWFGLPGILKGWVDRVFAMGFAYGMGRWYSRGVFAGKRAMLCLTTGGPAPMYEPDGVNGDIEQILFPIQHGMLYFAGFSVLPPFIAWSVARVTDAERKIYLDAWRDRLCRAFDAEPMAFPPLEAYDEQFQLKRIP
jgi:NAD(P)H dehydrogenase (quinone)